MTCVVEFIIADVGGGVNRTGVRGENADGENGADWGGARFRKVKKTSEIKIGQAITYWVGCF